MTCLKKPVMKSRLKLPRPRPTLYGILRQDRDQDLVDQDQDRDQDLVDQDQDLAV